MAVYDFTAQLRKGQAGESRLDSFFADWFTIMHATRDQQRQGIDRIFTCPYFEQTFTCEYKTDVTAARTGNAFVETVSVVGTQKPGWAYSSQATFLVYYVPGLERVWIIELRYLRAELPRWTTHYPVRRVSSGTWETEGMLVPLTAFDRIATWHGVIEG